MGLADLTVNCEEKLIALINSLILKVCIINREILIVCKTIVEINSIN
jgi:hypothetical protein